jgi:hypothetical protein
VNELELLTSLRDEVPLVASARIETAVLAEIAASRQQAADGSRRHRNPRLGRGQAPRRARSVVFRPVVAGALAAAVGAGTYAAVDLSGSAGQASPQKMAWSGKPTASWPAIAHASYGRATSEAQLIAYVTRAAAAGAAPLPGRAPKPNEWVAVKIESAGSTAGSGGYLFGPPDQRQIELAWIRGDGCAGASVPPVPANTAPSASITSELTINLGPYYYGPGCTPDGGLAGWKSVSYAYLNSLPTDPAALEDVLVENNVLGGSNPSTVPAFIGNRAQVIFQAIDNLLDAGQMEGVVVPPKLSAALYRVLQQLPGVRFETATDLGGRQGLGFSMVLEGYDMVELVIDPNNYTFMGVKDVAVRDHVMTGTDGTRYIKQGQVLGWAALLGQAIVEEPGQLPG